MSLLTGLKIFSFIGTIGGLGSSIAFIPWKSEVKDPARGHYVLASWEDGIEWTVNSKNFFQGNIYSSNGIGFDEVEMEIGKQKIEKDHQFYSLGRGRGSLLVKYNGRNGHYILEDGKEQLPGHLRINWGKLTSKKYSDKGFSEWKRGWNTLDYDLEFDKCRFKKNTENKDLITVTCQWGYNGARSLISRTLDSKDFRY